MTLEDAEADIAELRARSDAHRLILGVLIGRIALNSADWRDSLDAMLRYAEELFQDVRNALLEAGAGGETG